MPDTPTQQPILWRTKPRGRDLDDARGYLTLRLSDPDTISRLIHKLKHADPVAAHPADILRAFHRTPLPADDPRVQRKRDIVAAGKKFSPILAVHWSLDHGDIAQGYHELSVVFHDAPFEDVPVLHAVAD